MLWKWSKSLWVVVGCVADTNYLDPSAHALFGLAVIKLQVGLSWIKDPKQVKVAALTENKGQWENLNNTRQCYEKLLRNMHVLKGGCSLTHSACTPPAVHPGMKILGVKEGSTMRVRTHYVCTKNLLE